jgi:hypothetical protein
MYCPFESQVFLSDFEGGKKFEKVLKQIITWAGVAFIEALYFMRAVCTSTHKHPFLIS